MRDCGLDLRLAPDASSVALLAERLDAFAEANGVPAAAAHRLAVILDELVANVVMHGTDQAGAASYVAIAIRGRGRRLRVRIEDDGMPFDPLSLPTPDVTATLDERQVGGLGIHLVRTMAQEVRYERVSGHNRLDIQLAVRD